MLVDTYYYDSHINFIKSRAGKELLFVSKPLPNLSIRIILNLETIDGFGRHLGTRTFKDTCLVIAPYALLAFKLLVSAN